MADERGLWSANQLWTDLRRSAPRRVRADQLGLLRPGYASRSARRGKGEEAVADGGKEARGQHPVSDRVVVAAWRAPQIWPRPDEFVPLGQHDPGALGAEPQALLGLRGNFDRQRRLRRRAVRHRQNQHAGFAGVIGRA
jgi:hypothetical protein